MSGVTTYASEPLGGISEGFREPPAPSCPPEAGKGFQEAPVPSDGCPCVTCPEARDCGDDFYCVQFERWFTAQSKERWETA